MQTITFNDSNLSAYLLADDDTITATAEKTVCPDYIICDLNTSNSTIHTGITAPEDWDGGKYFFDGTTWTANSDYVAPPEMPPEGDIP